MTTEAIPTQIQEADESRVRAKRPKELPLAEAAELEELLSTLARRMFVLVPDHPTTKMSITQLRICSILQQGPRTVSNLGQEIGVTVSNISQIIERMVRIGVVERYETRDDRRLRLVKLSSQGLQAMESRKQHRIEGAAAALAKLELLKRREILGALQSLIDAAVAASPFRVIAGSAPDWITRVVRANCTGGEYEIGDSCML